MCYIHDRIFNNDKDVEHLEGTNITFGTKIYENYDLFKAHLLIFGNKQYLWKLFSYKQKEIQKTINDGVVEVLKNLREESAKTNISVSSELVTASKRQRKMPAGKPSGA